MRVLAFDIWGDYGHFKKFHTTSSPLSFSIPPPTAVYGIIGAITGLSKEEYLDRLKEYNLKVAINLNKPVKKIRFAVNIPADKTIPSNIFKVKERSQIKLEFLCDCSFRIYISGFNTFLDELKIFLINHRSVYTPCLGTAQCLANFSFTREFEGEVKKADRKIHIQSVIPSHCQLLIEKDKTYHKERLPVLMKQNRQVIDYRDVIYESNGKSLCIEGGEYVDLGIEKPIVFLNS
ncbi:MAG: type I-B CRISPR-associated protein Cas5b [Candidatus Eremiobacterota bacterium]